MKIAQAAIPVQYETAKNASPADCIPYRIANIAAEQMTFRSNTAFMGAF
jgi:hypothetical protein